DPITVNPGPATSLFVTGYPTSTAAGTSNTFSVTARDAFGNTATGYTGTVHFTSSDSQAVLPINATLTNGAGTFSAILKTAGTQSITGTDVTTGSITGTQSNISVTALGTSRLQVVASTSTSIAGSPLGVTVTAQDQYGNTATGYTGTIHFTSTDAQASLPGDYVFVAGDN